MATTNTEQLKSHAKEYVKQYIAYDVNNRPEYVYTAYIETADGGPCSVTQYTYDGLSSRIVKRKESSTTWDSSWDI